MNEREYLGNLKDRLVHSALKTGIEALPQMSENYAIENRETLQDYFLALGNFLIRIGEKSN